MLAYGKSYVVTPLNGEKNIYRSGKLAGTHAEVGFQVQVFGECTALAGTELAAHALAEVYKDVAPHRRLWVLTEDEYEEHKRILSDNVAALMAAFPYSDEEKASVDAHYEKYAQVTAEGERNIKRKLMNVWEHEFVVPPRALPRPSEFPKLAEDEPPAGMRL